MKGEIINFMKSNIVLGLLFTTYCWLRLTTNWHASPWLARQNGRLKILAKPMSALVKSGRFLQN